MCKFQYKNTGNGKTKRTCLPKTANHRVTAPNRSGVDKIPDKELLTCSKNSNWTQTPVSFSREHSADGSDGSVEKDLKSEAS